MGHLSTILISPPLKGEGKKIGDIPITRQVNEFCAAAELLKAVDDLRAAVAGEVPDVEEEFEIETFGAAGRDVGAGASELRERAPEDAAHAHTARLIDPDDRISAGHTEVEAV